MKTVTLLLVHTLLAVQAFAGTIGTAPQLAAQSYINRVEVVETLSAEHRVAAFRVGVASDAVGASTFWQLWPMLGTTAAAHTIGFFDNGRPMTWNGGTAHSFYGVKGNATDAWGNGNYYLSNTQRHNLSTSVYLNEAYIPASGYQMLYGCGDAGIDYRIGINSGTGQTYALFNNTGGYTLNYPNTDGLLTMSRLSGSIYASRNGQVYGQATGQPDYGFYEAWGLCLLRQGQPPWGGGYYYSAALVSLFAIADYRDSTAEARFAKSIHAAWQSIGR